MSPRARQAKGKARLNVYDQMMAADTAEKIDRIEIYIDPAQASATLSSKLATSRRRSAICS